LSLRAQRRVSAVCPILAEEGHGPRFFASLKLEILLPDNAADRVVTTIQQTVKTDKIGDGKIFVPAINRAVRIRTAEPEEAAV